jgi:ABC-type transporter MlaC component
MKIDQHFKSIQFVRQTTQGPDYAEVFSMVTFEDREDPISVTYLMRRQGNKWKIYDLKIKLDQYTRGLSLSIRSRA